MTYIFYTNNKNIFKKKKVELSFVKELNIRLMH